MRLRLVNRPGPPGVTQEAETRLLLASDVAHQGLARWSELGQPPLLLPSPLPLLPPPSPELGDWAGAVGPVDPDPEGDPPPPPDVDEDSPPEDETFPWPLGEPLPPGLLPPEPLPPGPPRSVDSGGCPGFGVVWPPSPFVLADPRPEPVDPREESSPSCSAFELFWCGPESFESPDCPSGPLRPETPPVTSSPPALS
jgi:hypothetical protein